MIPLPTAPTSQGPVHRPTTQGGPRLAQGEGLPGPVDPRCAESQMKRVLPEEGSLPPVAQVRPRRPLGQPLCLLVLLWHCLLLYSWAGPVERAPVQPPSVLVQLGQLIQNRWGHWHFLVPCEEASVGFPVQGVEEVEGEVEEGRESDEKGPSKH